MASKENPSVNKNCPVSATIRLIGGKYKALLLWFAASITTGQIDWLTTGVLQRSVGYSLFGAFNPFLLHY